MPIVPIDPAKSSETQLPRVRTRVRACPAPDQVPAPGTIDAEANEPSEAEDTYNVGYKKPPRHSQFKPGSSGNPKGRPKAAKGLHSLVRDTLTQKVAVRTATGTRKISKIEAVLQKTIEQAMKGNPRALGELLKLYANAVPNETSPVMLESREEDLTATDLATLEELRKALASGGE